MKRKPRTFSGATPKKEGKRERQIERGDQALWRTCIMINAACDQWVTRRGLKHHKFNPNF
jgi:hypothetical protein